MYVIGNDRTTCEFAISVASAFGGVALARSLTTALIDAAAKRGLQEMEGYVLAASTSSALRCAGAESACVSLPM
jgi:hypothetical protein